MKKKNQLFFTIFLLVTQSVFCQSDVSGPLIGHLRSNSFYIGWSTALGSTPGSLDIRNDFTEPINFYTATLQRMNITSTGTVGIGQTAPASLLHLNSTGNAVGGEVFRTTSATGVSRWRLETSNGEIFRITASGNATFLESMGQGGFFAFNTTGNMGTFTRMLMRDGTNDEFSGRIAMGNNLPVNFSIQDRLHLYETFGG